MITKSNSRTAEVEIAAAAGSECERVAGVVAAAFHPLSVSAWLVPDEARRTAILPAFFGIVVQHALDHGEVTRTADSGGVLVTFPQQKPVPDIPEYEERLAAVTGPYVDRFRTLDEAFEARHPHEPHHYLTYVAVEAGLQGQGIGAALLHDLHRRLDATETPAYLEAACPRSRALYHRLGYRDLGETIELPGDGDARLWPMWREPGVAAV